MRIELRNVVTRRQKTWHGLPLFARTYGISEDVLLNDLSLVHCESLTALERRYGFNRAEVLARYHEARRRHAHTLKPFDMPEVTQTGDDEPHVVVVRLKPNKS